MIREFTSAAAAQVEVEPIELETPKQSFRTSAFRNARKPTEETAALNSAPSPSISTDDLFAVTRSEKILASALVARKAGSNSKEELEHRLAQLMKCPAIRAVMQSARALAQDNGITEQQAVQDIISSMNELASIWDQLLTREGLERLSESK